MGLFAFSVKQPWAGLLVAGVKRFEARTWPPKRQGLFLVHASSGKSPGMPELRAEPLFQRSLGEAGMTDERAWPESAFLGLVEIAAVIGPDDDLPEDLTEQDEFLCGNMDGMFLWRVGRRWPFSRPVPCHGKLNLWQPPAAVHAALDAELTAADALVRIGGGSAHA
jgi:activating signal cointegrator 1